MPSYRVRAVRRALRLASDTTRPPSWSDLVPPPPATPGSTPSGPLATVRERLRGRDLGQLPVFLALMIVAIFFQIATGGDFLTARNLTELVGEIITIGSIALGDELDGPIVPVPHPAA